MNKRNLILVLIVFLSVVVGLILGNLLAHRAGLRGTQGDYSFLSKSFSSNKLDEVLALIDQQYVDSIDVNELTEEMMVDLIAKLDPHSVYIPAADLENVNSELEGSFSGIGVQFNIQNDTITIVSVISGGPSEKVGLLAGDRIVEVNDTAFTGKKVTNEKVMKKLRGKANTKVKLGIRRHGTAEKLTYTVTRGEIPVNSVDVSYIIAPQTGFIKVSKFAATTYSEFLNAIADLRAKGARKYIIDLRENSGGFMDQAINMVNEFLPANQMIVYSEGKAYPRYEARATGKGSLISAPVVVLIDEFSASASEIFAGAIQDNDRGTVIGRRSFGKGLVQQQMDLTDGSAVRLTVARYYTPSGRSIQKPYENGKADDYELDILNRYMHGEIDNKDSVQLKDTLKYKTLKGRTVYGGGGIMPDIFVSRDTSEYSTYLNKVVNYGYLYQFAFQYSDQHRNTLKAFRDWQKMEAHLNTQNLLAEFVKFAGTKGVKPTGRDLAISGKFIQRQLNAYITRNIIGENGFYPLFYKDDKTILKAIDVLANKKASK
ncbi:MAG: S41 family peptidase [Bacteroidia bacterium]|nr:S41 family peptidase [Bacteroidia bacterium]